MKPLECSDYGNFTYKLYSTKGISGILLEIFGFNFRRFYLNATRWMKMTQYKEMHRPVHIRNKSVRVEATFNWIR